MYKELNTKKKAQSINGQMKGTKTSQKMLVYEIEVYEKNIQHPLPIWKCKSKLLRDFISPHSEQLSPRITRTMVIV